MNVIPLFCIVRLCTLSRVNYDLFVTAINLRITNEWMKQLINMCISRIKAPQAKNQFHILLSGMMLRFFPNQRKWLLVSDIVRRI